MECDTEQAARSCFHTSVKAMPSVLRPETNSEATNNKKPIVFILKFVAIDARVHQSLKRFGKSGKGFRAYMRIYIILLSSLLKFLKRKSNSEGFGLVH